LRDVGFDMTAKQAILLSFAALFVLFSGESSASPEQAYICGKNNSLVFLEPPSATKFPREARLNTQDMKFCSREGNFLVYRTGSCEMGNTVIRFDWVLGELVLNEAPDKIVLKCVRRS
jgi:hypothetical protein